MLRGLLALSALLIGAEPPATPLRSEPTAAAEAPAKKKRTRRVRYGELAARLADDEECERAVKVLSQKSETAGWSLIVACADQDKFRSLPILLSEQWKPRLLALPREQQLRLIAHLLSTGGGWFGDELPLIEKAGIPLRTLAAAMEEPRRTPDDYIVFRGKLTSRKLLPSGMVHLSIAERGRMTIDRQGWVYSRERGYEVGKTGSRDSWQETGLEVESEVGELPALVREDNEYVFLAVLRQVETAGTIAHVRIVDVFKPGVLVALRRGR